MQSVFTLVRPGLHPQVIIVVSSFAGALFMLGVLGLYRFCTSKREFNYQRVAHSLDEEEQAFKRTLEMQVRRHAMFIQWREMMWWCRLKSTMGWMYAARGTDDSVSCVARGGVEGLIRVASDAKLPDAPVTHCG
jgi:hypothetical protein